MAQKEPGRIKDKKKEKWRNEKGKAKEGKRRKGEEKIKEKSPGRIKS